MHPGTMCVAKHGPFWHRRSNGYVRAPQASLLLLAMVLRDGNANGNMPQAKDQ